MNRIDPVFPGVNFSLRSLLETSDLLQNVPNSNRLNNSNPPVAHKASNVSAPSAVGQAAASPTSGSNSGIEKKKDESEDVWGYLEAQASFLGPSLWDNGDLKMEYMDLDEFLCENGIPVAEGMVRSPNKMTPPRSVASVDGSSGSGGMGRFLDDGSKPGSSNAGHYPESPVGQLSPTQRPMNDDDDSNGSASTTSSGLESMIPAVMSPAPQRRKRNAVSISSSVDNTSDDGSYVPGQDFDPKSRQFSPEELRPQPMSKKSKKQYVPDDLKDDKYWARRRKNNMAAKRSRDARRVKENQIAMRAAFLEKEVNAVLKAELDKVTKLYTAALKRLEHYEKQGKKC